MGNSNGRITAPVNTDDVSTVLGHASHDVATLCSSSKINPASKKKPIRFDKPSSLSEDDRLGAPADKLEGIYYGIKMAPYGKALYTLHDYNYEYQKIRPGTDWSRLDDFVGYDHKAKFNPTGTVEAQAVKEYGCPVTIDYDTLASGTGVDVAELIPKLSSDATFTLAKCYPCALVTLGSKRYVRALWNLSYDITLLSGKTGFTQMQVSNAWVRNWLIILNDLPNLKANDELTVTIFFMQKINDVNATAGTDFRSWVEVTSTLINAQRTLTCPDAVAKKVTALTNYPKAIKVTGVVMTNNSALVNYTPLTGTDAPGAGRTYTINVELTIKDTGTGRIIGSKTVSSFGDINFFQFATGVYSGATAVVYRVNWWVSESGGTIVVNSGSFETTLAKA